MYLNGKTRRWHGPWEIVFPRIPSDASSDVAHALSVSEGWEYASDFAALSPVCYSHDKCIVVDYDVSMLCSTQLCLEFIAQRFSQSLCSLLFSTVVQSCGQRAIFHIKHMIIRN